jgi:alanyl-tRNA synthetase
VEELRKLSDVIRARERNALVCLGSVYDDNPLLLCSTTSSVVGRGADCHHIIQSVSRYIDGRGGGRKDMAQAGGKNTGGLDKALEEAVRLAGEMVVRRP